MTARCGEPISAARVNTRFQGVPDQENSLRPHRRIAARTARRRDHRHGAALRRRRMHIRINAGRRTQHAVGSCELVAQGFSATSRRSARGDGAFMRNSLGRCAIRRGTVGIGRRGLRRRCRWRRRSLSESCRWQQRKHTAGGESKFHCHQKQTAAARRCSRFEEGTDSGFAIAD